MFFSYAFSLLIGQWEEYVRQGVEKDVSEEDIEQLRGPGSELQERSLSFVNYEIGTGKK